MVTTNACSCLRRQLNWHTRSRPRTDVARFLSRDCSLARRGVWLFVTFVHCVETNNYILKLFSSSSSHTFLVFADQTLSLFRGGPFNCGKNRDFRHISRFGVDDWWSVECCKQISTVESVDNTRRRTPFNSRRRWRRNATHQWIITWLV